MKNLLLIIMLVNATIVTQLQSKTNPNLDSLLSVIEQIYENHPDSAYKVCILANSLIKNKEINEKEITKLLLFEAKILVQIGQEDKALQKLKEAKKGLEISSNDLTKMKLNLEFVKYYLLIRKKDVAKKYLQILDSISIHSKIDSDRGWIEMYKGYLTAPSPEIAVIHYDKALNLAQLDQDSLLLGTVHSMMGLFYYLKKSDYNQSILHYENSIEIFEKLNYKRGLGLSFMRLSSVFRRQEDYSRSIQYNLKGIEYAKQSNYVRGQIAALANMGNVYAHLNRSDDGLHYRKRAARKAIENAMYSSLPSIYNNIGSSFVKSNPDSAKYYLEQCIYYSTQVQNLENLGISKLNLAFLYQDQGHYNKAEQYFTESIIALKEGFYERHISFAQTSFVKFYLQWAKEGIELRREIDFVKMKVLLDEAAPNLIGQKDYLASELLYKAYIELYSAEQNLDSSNYYMGQLINLRDSLISKTNINNANEWAEKLKTAEKEKEIVLLESENKIAKFRNKMFLLALIATILFFGILGYVVQKYIKQRNAKLRIEEAQQFRSKLSSNLHDDVGSVLSNLSLQSEIVSLSSTPKQKQELNEIALMSREAMESLRDTVWAIDARKDKYENLVDRMIEYASRHLKYKNMDLQFQKNIWEGKTEINPEKRQNIYLIFKEAIANIVKHSNGDKVALIVDQADSVFTLQIKDNGLVNSEKISDGSGLANMKMRANDIGGTIKIIKDHGFEVFFQMPI